MTTKNSITGDTIQTKPSTDAYRKGYDRIFNRGDVEAQEVTLGIEEPHDQSDLLILHHAPSYLLEIHNDKPIATIGHDGTVTIHQKGADKEAAELFWASMQIKGQTLFSQIADLQSKVCVLKMKNTNLEEYNDVLSAELRYAAVALDFQDDLIDLLPEDI